MRTLNRRQFLGLGLVALPAAAGIDGRFAEPTWLRITHLDLHSQSTCRFVRSSRVIRMAARCASLSTARQCCRMASAAMSEAATIR